MVKKIIKKFIKIILPKRMRYKLIYLLNKCRLENINTKSDKIKYLLKNYFSYKVYVNNDEVKRIKKLYKKIDLKSNGDSEFIYIIDKYKVYYYKNANFGNGTIDYSLILDYSLEDLIAMTPDKSKKGLLHFLSELANKTYISNSNNKNAIYFKRLINNKCEGFEEALQRILFVNQILWQTNHPLVGLGRLDNILLQYVKDESDEQLLSVIRNFLLTLHKDYKFKSGELYGDTGQIIILGGSDKDGNDTCNRLTPLFIKAIKESHIPDPKVLLRVNSKTPREIIEASVKCIETGVGCPLFANDDVIIPKLIDFSYDIDDAYNYVTAACWEPFPANKSSENPNSCSLNFVRPLIDTLDAATDNNINSINDFIERYKDNLKNEINDVYDHVSKFKYDSDYLSSCFIISCLTSESTIGSGGAKYKNFGVTGVGLGNVIDSLIVIDDVVFKEKAITFTELKEILKNNYYEKEDILQSFKENHLKYGNDEEYVINLANDIICYTKNLVHKYDNDNYKIKFGLSSPSYINDFKNLTATPDGRKSGDPANVHISCSKPIAFTELMDFASKLDYSDNCFNGNVVDFIVNRSFIENNFDKFVDFIIASFKIGIFEMQMNVVDSNTLIAAQKNPELFPNLIVRVWGFSAYFNDLPLEYQNILIERTLRSERC